ncbi:hypothetical protein BHYA_0078g00360 [Botrytis hyacinthi]|uniref:MARVEL domain-containing protein n=1 Tax=Botrytis hyacinthi TaxID=278943 RepID=A0A4Z1GY97_9HELO|nr:hypothetical protein BHYA_0078g00360 [Botrytis hyacinthi]
MAGFLSKFHNSKFYPLLQRVLRTLQFLSALSSLIVFSIHIRRILKLYRSISHAEGAIEGILAAAIAYTLAIMVLKLCMRNGGPKFLRWVLVVLDIAFVGAFIAVAVLTSPNVNDINSILHALTAAFQDTRERHREHEAVKEEHSNRDNNMTPTNPIDYNQDRSAV